MSAEESSKDNALNECPVCYERLHSMGTAERRLNCGHVFCHDCLVKYLLSNNEEGHMQKNIICPLCRYVTFLSKKSLWSNSSVQNNQTLEMPLSPTCPWYSPALRPSNTLIIPNSGVLPGETTNGQLDITSYHANSPLDSATAQNRFTSGSQIFVISDQGRPMDNEESVRPTPRQSRQRRCCQWPVLIPLLTMVFVVAILCAVLPWLLLMKNHM
ncbi:RING finger protein 222 [Rhinatrema bivittatum]|uniref:RING finger protein 222 n=1 Tax=Rhinatrema bivittatum TaxID=194408 RepID=UPI00112DE020|nr:RING finger protein 222 [Rhinatrema bivittatum]